MMSIVHISVTYKTKTWSLIPHLRKTVNKSYGILFQEMKKKCYRKSRNLDFLEIILKSIFPQYINVVLTLSFFRLELIALVLYQ